MNELTWTTTVRMEQLPLSIMFWLLRKDKEYYETIPLTFIVQDTRLVTISNEDNAYVISKMQDYVDNHEDLSIYKLLFAGLEMISNAYYPVIECLDQQKMRLVDV